MIKSLYKIHSGLFTDFYELTMAYGFWKNNMVNTESVFSLFYRSNPFNSSYAIACGLDSVIDFLENFSFSDEDIAFLRQQKNPDGTAIFEEGFLEYLNNFQFSCDIYAVPEGTLVFPYEPLLTVHGPVIQAQLLETVLLNLVNYQSLIATKASRVCHAAKNDAVLEFGLRRAQGPDGGVSASRAAYIGGCTGTSNVLAGRLFNIPVKGTHAHSWVMAFDTEEDAFKAYAQALPSNCIFLVDTYDTIEGIKNAIDRGLELKEKGYRMLGIRLDSGDLVSLSKEGRKMLDKAGLEDVSIVASNELDEHVIDDLKQKGAEIDVWGVGTKLVTAYDQPALGGVYKLSALKNAGEEWNYKLKLSEEEEKVSDPGLLQVRRYYDEKGISKGDAIYHIENPPADNVQIADRVTGEDLASFKNENYADLLIKIFEKGERVYKKPDIREIKHHLNNQWNSFEENIKNIYNPVNYKSGLEKWLFDKKKHLIEKINLQEKKD